MNNTIRYFIYAIFLVITSQAYAEKPLSSPDINRFLGCWNSADNQNWEYGFFEKFAIYDCDFWKYESIKSYKDKAEIILRKGDETVKLKLVFQDKSDSICTIITPKKSKKRMVRYSAQPDYTIEDHSEFVDNGYRMDSVTIIGYLRNAQRDKPFEVSINNVISGNEESFYADIDSLGRFRMTVPVINATNCYLDWHEGGLTIPGVLEPKDTLFVYYDYNQHDTRFMGRNARLHHEIKSYRQYPPNRDGKKYLSYDAVMEHEVYLSKRQEMYKDENKCFDDYLPNHPRVSDKFKQYTRMSTLTELATALMQRRFVLRMNFNKEFFSPTYMEYVSQLFRQMPSSLTLFNTSEFLKNYLDYYNMDACPITSGSNEAIRYLNKEKRYPLSEQQLDDLKAYEQVFSIGVMGRDAKADSLLIDSMTEPFEKGALRMNKLMGDTTLQRLISECIPIFSELMELKNINDYFYCFNHLQLPQITKEWMVARTFYGMLYNSKKALCESSIEYFNSLISNEYFRKTILESQKAYKNLEKQDLFYAESLKKTDHLKGSKDADKLLKELIAPYKGKVIYLDIWGTWCGPCKKEMTYVPAIKEAMFGKDVIFMYLANNSPEESWKNVIKENQLTGPNVVHYNLPGEQQKMLERRLSIKFFPTYILIDKEGNLVNLNAPSPKNKNMLFISLEKLLAE